MNGTRTLVVLALSLALGATPSAAQGPPTLDAVEEAVRHGRTEEARAILSEWWRSAGPKASRRDTQRGLWLRGQLTTDAARAELDFNRLVVEFPGGPWSDQALLRLAQAAYAAGDSAAAAARVQRLAMEYPSSPVRREAEAWLATAGPVPEPLGPAPAAPTGPGPARPAAADSAPRAPAGETPPRPAQAGGEAETGEFTIQLGAFSTVARAEALLAQLADAGFQARLARVPGSDLVRVRLGRFDAAEGVQELLWQVRDRGFTATLARDAHREERVVR